MQPFWKSSAQCVTSSMLPCPWDSMHAWARRALTVGVTWQLSIDNCHLSGLRHCFELLTFFVSWTASLQSCYAYWENNFKFVCLMVVSAIQIFHIFDSSIQIFSYWFWNLSRGQSLLLRTTRDASVEHSWIVYCIVHCTDVYESLFYYFAFNRTWRQCKSSQKRYRMIGS